MHAAQRTCSLFSESLRSSLVKHLGDHVCIFFTGWLFIEVLLGGLQHDGLVQDESGSRSPKTNVPVTRHELESAVWTIHRRVFVHAR